MAVLERGDQGAGNASLATLARAHELGECRFHPPKVCQLRPHVAELVLGQSAGLRAMRAIVQAKQIRDFAQAEAQPLRRPHEAQPLDIGLPIAANTPEWFLRCSQQAPALIEPDGLDVDACRAGEGPDGQYLSIAAHALDPVLRYGPKLTPNDGNSKVIRMTEPMISSATRGGRSALVAGGLAAILASTCCLGPLILVALGFSGAWIGNLTTLEPYRPIFLAVSLGALVFAGLRIFRPARACKPGEVCATSKARKAYKVLFGVVAALVLIALAFPYVLPFFY